MRKIIALIALLLPLSASALDLIYNFEWLEPGNSVEIAVGEAYQLKFNCSNNNLVFTDAYSSNWNHYEFNPSQRMVDKPTGYSIDAKGVIKGLVPGTYAIKFTGWIQAKDGADKWLDIKIVSERRESESNNSMYTANAISSKIRFGLYNTTDVDYFQYTNSNLHWGDRVTFKIHYYGSRANPFGYKWATFSGSDVVASGSLTSQDQECNASVISGNTVFLEVYFDQSRSQYFNYGDEFVAEVFINGIPADVFGAKYTLTYLVDGAIYRSYEIGYGSAITPEADPYKEGYTFLGWSNIPSTMPANDVTVTGTFKVNQYTITYYVDDIIYHKDVVDYGSTLVPPSMPEREGYTFVWHDLPYSMPARDLQIYGRYMANRYTLTYEVDGRIYKQYQVEYGSTITPEAAPEIEGYVFLGWNDVPETMPAHDVLIKGSVEPREYTLTYMVNDEVYKVYTVTFGAAITPETAPEREGYTFSGWKKEPKTMPANDVVVTGKFIPILYNLYYQLDGDSYKHYCIKYGDTIPVEPDPEEKEGYTFSGWSEVPETMPAHDVIVTGTYIINQYMVTFAIDEEVVFEQRMDYGSAIVVPENPEEKEGYTFSGWGNVDETVPAHDVTYTATYSVNKYTIRYYVGDQLIAEDEVEYGAEVVLRNYTPEDADRYSFVGWEGEKYETMPAHDIEYHANIADGIVDLSSLNDIKSIFDASGRKLSKLQRGVNVVVMKDGTTKKVVVK